MSLTSPKKKRRKQYSKTPTPRFAIAADRSLQFAEVVAAAVAGREREDRPPEDLPFQATKRRAGRQLRRQHKQRGPRRLWRRKQKSAWSLAQNRDRNRVRSSPDRWSPDRPSTPGPESRCVEDSAVRKAASIGDPIREDPSLNRPDAPIAPGPQRSVSCSTRGRKYSYRSQRSQSRRRAPASRPTSPCRA